VSNTSPGFSLIPRESSLKSFRGRLAPSPTGLLHIGHARTFWIAAQRAIENQGTLILRNEDLDPQRSRPEFARAMIADLLWLGVRWSRGRIVAGRMALSRKVSAGHTIWTLGGVCAMAGFCIRARARARIWRRQ